MDDADVNNPHALLGLKFIEKDIRKRRIFAENAFLI
jgi:hypothetical protein